MHITQNVADIVFPDTLSEGERRTIDEHTFKQPQGFRWKLIVTKKRNQCVVKISLLWDPVFAVAGLTGTISFTLYQLLSVGRAVNSRKVHASNRIEFTSNRSGKWIRLSSIDFHTNSNQYIRKCYVSISIEADTIEEQFNTLSVCEKPDAVLLVEGKKIPVDRAHLCSHSEYFKTLFNSEFKDKSMDEIPIGEVSFDNFTALLGLLPPYLISPNVDNVEDLLMLSYRFLMPSALRVCEEFLIKDNEMNDAEKMYLADQHHLEKLLKASIWKLKSVDDFQNVSLEPVFDDLADSTKVAMLHRLLNILPISSTEKSETVRH